MQYQLKQRDHCVKSTLSKEVSLLYIFFLIHVSVNKFGMINAVLIFLLNPFLSFFVVGEAGDVTC